MDTDLENSVKMFVMLLTSFSDEHGANMYNLSGTSTNREQGENDHFMYYFLDRISRTLFVRFVLLHYFIIFYCLLFYTRNDRFHLNNVCGTLNTPVEILLMDKVKLRLSVVDI